jgi:Tfp pilus assembly protein PilX
MRTASRQRGLALFFALICMVAVMLAAVVLVRSVDTATLISGNLAFQQSATRSADAGTEAAITWLLAQQAANSQKNVLIDATHAFNQDAPTLGYYSSLDPAKSLTATSGTRFLWDATDSIGLAEDTSGNTVRYIIQRMCRTPNVGVSTANCLLSAANVDTNGQNILLPQEVCSGPGCPASGQTPQVRITSRVIGPKNTISYVQAFVN